MNSQELRNLQESYRQVYEADDPMTGFAKFKARMDREEAEKKAGKKTTSNSTSSQPSQSSSRETVAQRARRDRTFRDKMIQDRMRPLNNSYDLYDIILSHLLDEGYADTQEAAESIMVNMSEDWREDIVEVLTGERYKKVMKKPGGTAYSRMVSADPAKRATRGGRGGESDFGAGDRGSGNKSRRRRGLKVDYDIND